MNWLKEQDRELARLLRKVQHPLIIFGARCFVAVGAFAELIVYIFTHEDVRKLLDECDFGLLGWYLEHGRRRVWRQENMKRVRELLDAEFGDEWVEELGEKRLRLDL